MNQLNMPQLAENLGKLAIKFNRMNDSIKSSVFVLASIILARFFLPRQHHTNSCHGDLPSPKLQKIALCSPFSPSPSYW